MLAFMNQVEIWLSMLVRKLLKRGNFTSLDDLRDQVLADHSTPTIARWLNLVSGRPLASLNHGAISALVLVSRMVIGVVSFKGMRWACSRLGVCFQHRVVQGTWLLVKQCVLLLRSSRLDISSQK